MTDAGFYRGTNSEQDSRFSDKNKKLMKQMKFSECLDKKINMSKINLDVLKPWITKRLCDLLSFEDDVVIEFVFNQLMEKNVDPKLMQINLTGFLNAKNARIFMGDLWSLLLSAQENISGIPEAFVQQKKAELIKKYEEESQLKEMPESNISKEERYSRDKDQSKRQREQQSYSPVVRERSRDSNTKQRHSNNRSSRHRHKRQHHQKKYRRSPSNSSSSGEESSNSSTSSSASTSTRSSSHSKIRRRKDKMEKENSLKTKENMKHDSERKLRMKALESLSHHKSEDQLKDDRHDTASRLE